MILKRKFDDGEFAILAEMEPPKGVDVSAMLADAKRVRNKVDAFVVPEMSNAVMRISSLGGAMILRKAGLEAVIQVCCRDRNRLALQGDLLAAAALGITTVMAVDGEDPSFGDHHQARSVNDLDLIEMLEMIQTLQKGRDMAGIELAGTPQFVVGSTSDAGAKGKSPEMECSEMSKRAGAGARFFITPPVFDTAVLAPYLKRIDPRKTILIPTVLLLKSLGMARYIERNMPHITIPAALIDRIQKAPEKVRECIQIAAETVSTLKREGFNGVLLSTIGWERRLPDILEKV